MPLISLWDTNPDAISQLTVEQVVGTAGDGNLKDDNDCSSELRQFLSQVPSHRLFHTSTNASHPLFREADWYCRT